MRCSWVRMSGCQQQAPAPDEFTQGKKKKKSTWLYCSILLTIFMALQAFCLNLGSIFKPDKITIGKTNGLICGE